LLSLTVLGVVFGGTVVVQRLATLPIGASDFNAYWSASRLLLEGRNPTDPANMLEMERAYFNPDQDFTMMAWNPPMLWVFMLPVAWLPFQTARVTWLLINVTLAMASCLMLGRVYMPRGRVAPLLTYLLLAACFSPMLLAFLTGQVTFLVVFGVAACLFMVKQQWWFGAGAALILTSVKPHLVILVGPYLLLYIAARRKWAGWLGLGLSGAACVAILFVLRSSWLVDFMGLLDAPPVDWATPTLGGLLSLYGAGRWVRFIGLGFLLVLPVLIRRPEQFSLETSASVLTLLTIPTTFFGWSYDQSLLLIPIAQVVGWLFEPMRSALGRWLLVAAMLAALAANMAQRVATTDEVYFFWVPLAWAGVYVATRYLRRNTSSPLLV
jgi:hypothetical protein